jgi:DNA recombination protein RmuC
LLILVAVLAIANLGFSLFLLARLADARRDAAQHQQFLLQRQQQSEASLQTLTQTTALLFEQARQMLQTDQQMHSRLEVVGSHAEQMLQTDQTLVNTLEVVGSRTEQMLRTDQTLVSTLEVVGSRTEQMLQIDQALNREIGIVREATGHILAIKEEIARLQNLLQSTRQRGRLGEVLLEALLRDALPPSAYVLQHQFANGTRADAVIRLDKACVAVDSKFPLSSYERLLSTADGAERDQLARQFVRDVRKHIDDIATKYIVPAEGTLDFALMFVPSEAVYYELVTHESNGGGEKDLLSYAFEQRVFPVSPSTFYPYLLTIARGLRQLYVAENVRQTIAEIAQLQQMLAQQARKWETARRQIDDARRNLGEVQAAMDEVRDKILRIISPSAEVLGATLDVDEIDT